MRTCTLAVSKAMVILRGRMKFKQAVAVTDQLQALEASEVLAEILGLGDTALPSPLEPITILSTCAIEMLSWLVVTTAATIILVQTKMEMAILVMIGHRVILLGPKPSMPILIAISRIKAKPTLTIIPVKQETSIKTITITKDSNITQVQAVPDRWGLRTAVLVDQHKTDLVVITSLTPGFHPNLNLHMMLMWAEWTPDWMTAELIREWTTELPLQQIPWELSPEVMVLLFTGDQLVFLTTLTMVWAVPQPAKEPCPLSTKAIRWMGGLQTILLGIHQIVGPTESLMRMQTELMDPLHQKIYQGRDCIFSINRPLKDLLKMTITCFTPSLMAAVLLNLLPYNLCLLWNNCFLCYPWWLCIFMYGVKFLLIFLTWCRNFVGHKFSINIISIGFSDLLYCWRLFQDIILYCQTPIKCMCSKYPPQDTYCISQKCLLSLAQLSCLNFFKPVLAVENFLYRFENSLLTFKKTCQIVG